MIALGVVAVVGVGSPAGAATSTVPSVVDYSQCANGAPPSTSLTCPGGWINGILQSSNSHYQEDDVTPQRVMVSVPAAGSGMSHSFTFRYLARKDSANAHAYDSLSTWNLTQSGLTTSTTDRCAGLKGVTCPTTPTSTFGIPADNTDVYPVGVGITPTTSAHSRPGVMLMFGGTITSISTPVHSNPIAGTGDDYATITITYTVPSSTKAQNVQLLFGGHLAAGLGPDGWGAGLGAGSISGGPYHIKWDQLDGTSVGNRDNQIQSTAIKPLPPAFSIRKSASPTTAAPGGVVTYTIAITNTGQTAGTATFQDNYQVGVTILDDAAHPLPSGCTNDAGARLLTCQVGPINPASTTSISYYAKMPASFPDTSNQGLAPCSSTQYRVHNTATLSSGGSSSADVCVTAAPAFTVKKAANPTTVDAGGSVTYTVTVTNTGTAPGSDSFTDSYRSDVTLTAWPNGCTNDAANHVLTCATGTLAPLGGAQMFSYTAQMPSSFTGSAGGGPCTNTQFLVQNKAVLPDGSSASANVCVNAAPHLFPAKSANPTTSTPGGIVQYTVTVTNDGSAPGSGQAVDQYQAGVTILNDAQHPFPSACQNNTSTHTVTCTTGTLNPNTSQQFVYYAMMPTSFSGSPGGAPCTGTQFRVVNTVTVNGNSASADVCVETSPTFVPSKSVTPSSGVTPGGTVTYTVTITNNGTGAGATSFTDQYQAGVTINDATLPAGCSDNIATRTITCQTGTIAANGGTQAFSYQASMPASFPDTSNRGLAPCATDQYRVHNVVTVGSKTASADVCVNAAPSFGKTKTASPTGPVDPGATVTYTITVSNSGTAPGSTSFDDTYSSGVTLTSVPAGCQNNTATRTLTCTTGQLAPNGSQQFVYTATMPTSYTGTLGGSGCSSTQLPVANSVVFDGGSTPTTVIVCVNMPVLSVSKSACTANPIPANGELSYTLTFGNSGSAPATNTVLTDTIPAGTSVADASGGTVTTSNGATTVSWSIGTLAVGATGTRTLTVAVNPANTSGQLINTATLASTETSATSNTVNNGISDTGAMASGRANGVTVRLLDGSVIGPVPDVTSGSSQLITLPAALSGIVSAGVLTVSNTSSVTPTEAQDSAVSTAAGVNVNLAGLVSVHADAVVARADSFATGSTARTVDDGSEVLGLSINGTTIGDVSSPRVITVVNLLGIPVAEVDVLEETDRSGAALGGTAGAQPQGGLFESGMAVNGLHVKVLGSTLEAIVSHAESKAQFPTLTPCTTSSPYVVGRAVVADETLTYPTGATRVAVDPIILPSTGGDVSATANSLDLTPIGATSGTATDATHGTLSPLHANSSASVQNLSLLGISAQAVASNAAASPDTGSTTILNLTIGSLDVCQALGGLVNQVCTPAPNTVLVDLTHTLKIVLNEQLVSANQITVNAVHVYVLGAGNPLGLPVGSDLVISGSTAGTSS